MSIPDFDFLINSPFETEKDILENLNFIKKLHGPFDAQMHNLHLFPGSKLYAKAIENGISPYENLGHEKWEEYDWENWNKWEPISPSHCKACKYSNDCNITAKIQ